MNDLFSAPEILVSESSDVLSDAQVIVEKINSLSFKSKIYAINKLRKMIHEISPFKNEPVDCVEWIPANDVSANDYNPNSVAPPEMRLLEHSIIEDGYTQPIVAWKNGGVFEVVDGFHRNRVGKESDRVRKRVFDYLPLTIINESRLDRSDRIAATIRHNRARGKHRVEAMSDIVIELKRRNWSDDKIGRELGMEPDEVLRLCQITGLAEAFKDQEFSEAWEVNRTSGQIKPGEELLSDVLENIETNDNGRIFHEWDKWECYRHGFYAEKPEGMTQDAGEERYREFLSDLQRFEGSLKIITSEWKYSELYT